MSTQLEQELAAAKREIAAIKCREETYVDAGNHDEMIPWFDLSDEERAKAIAYFGPDEDPKPQKNPTIAVHVTRKELDILIRKVGYTSAYTTLWDKLVAAEKGMRLLTRAKNRAHKTARRQRAAAQS